MSKDFGKEREEILAQLADETPAYIIDEKKLLSNLEILANVQKETGAKILLAQKCFSLFRLYPLIGKYLSGCASSGLFEARLANEEMGKENHVFSPAFKEKEFAELCRLCDHIIFNSLTDAKKFAPAAKKAGVSCGLRINPEHSTQKTPLYDPCAANSRLGVKRREISGKLPPFIEGLHFHTLCEQNSDALAQTLAAVEEKFGEFLPQMKWINFGGGHHITRDDYDLTTLKKCIEHFRRRYDLTVYLEPGEAVALNAGFLAAKVLSVCGDNNAIIDASAACHAPDVLEMPYRPRVTGASLERGNCAYRLGAATCLAGDVFGEYYFPKPLQEGDVIFFEDMAIYTMVKNNTFNGIPLPSVFVWQADGKLTTIKKFGYEHFKERLG